MLSPRRHEGAKGAEQSDELLGVAEDSKSGLAVSVEMSEHLKSEIERDNHVRDIT